MGKTMKRRKNIKNTLKQLDVLLLPEKEKILSFNGDCQTNGVNVREVKRENYVSMQFIPLYSALALIVVFALGFMAFNRDSLFGGNNMIAPQTELYSVEASAIGIEPVADDTESAADTIEPVADTPAFDNTSIKPVNQGEAEQIALERIGGGEIIDIELDKKNGRLVYELEVVHDGWEYDIRVDVETGEIVRQTRERVAHAETQPTIPNDNRPQGIRITVDEAQEIAIAIVGGGFITDVELDSKNGIIYYEIDVFYDGVEYELEIDAATGGIFGNDSGIEINFGAAIQIAVAQVGGGTVKEIELSVKQGRLVYDVEVFHNLIEYDVRIDVETGEIVKFKIDD
ncbi:MAG: PepSY domain-containing protein [Oscillospiraceae bacterium]|nr:PepSY domain-containing protein [Oscillospiraceae bacterium]